MNRLGDSGLTSITADPSITLPFSLYTANPLEDVFVKRSDTTGGSTFESDSVCHMLARRIQRLTRSAERRHYSTDRGVVCAHIVDVGSATDTHDTPYAPLVGEGLVFVGQDTLTALTASGHWTTVAATVKVLRRYFGDAEIFVQYGDDEATKPIALTVVGSADVDESFDRLTRFDDEWWLDQPLSIRSAISVYLA